MLREACRRDVLKLSLSRSLSEPGVPTEAPPPSLPLIAASSPSSGDEDPQQRLLQIVPPALSMPSSPCSESVTLQRALLLRRIKLLEPSEVARRLTKNPLQKTRPFLLLDLRSFVAYNLRHIRGGINLNCSDRINRRRLQQKRANIVDLAMSPVGRELLKKRTYRQVIVYDDGSREVENLPPSHPVFLILVALLEENREPFLLKGGFAAFQDSYPELCEHSLMAKPPRSIVEQVMTPDDPFKASPWDSSIQDEVIPLQNQFHLCSPGFRENAIEHAPVTQVLPFLFLGNAQNAKDFRVLQALSITEVLNVTVHASPTFVEGYCVRYKNLPALDSEHQNLKQYFEEAFAYIDNARKEGTRVLVHCQAGVSRSPTIVLAYLMKHTRMTMLDAYKLLKSRRPIISPNLNFMGQLVEWESVVQATKSEPDCKPCHQCQWQKQEVKKVPNACQV